MLPEAIRRRMRPVPAGSLTVHLVAGELRTNSHLVAIYCDASVFIHIVTAQKHEANRSTAQACVQVSFSRKMITRSFVTPKADGGYVLHPVILLPH